MDTAALGTDILREVSRSFYLTLRLLPSGFRAPMSLGYLLARLSDTIADAGTVAPEKRRELLEQYRVLLSAPAKYREAQQFACALPGELRDAGLPRGEWDLVLRTADCFAWLNEMDRKVSKHVRKVVGTITEGQGWDLTRFDGGGVVRLESDEELEHYADMVAGCVGRFWTEVGFGCEESFSRGERHELLRWGTNYGKGLQLVNILRDVAEDRERGRCYLPGIGDPSPDELVGDAQRWQERARELLADGFRYTATLTGIRLQAATGLPAILGLRTLDRLRVAKWDELQAGVKISRTQVKRSFVRAFMMSTPFLPGSWSGAHRRACQQGRS